MHKAICTKVQDKTNFEIKLNNVDQTFCIFYFSCGFWIFDTQEGKDWSKQQCKNILNEWKQKQTNNFQFT